jgi:hypothetical protein
MMNGQGSFKPQERDLSILRGFFESRIMTSAHVSALHFEGKTEATKKRLQKLKAAGIVGERRRRVNEPSILFLTKKAFQILNREGILNEYPRIGLSSVEKRAQVSELTLRHELEVMDVKSAFHSHLRGISNLTIAEFTTWPLLCQFEAFRPGVWGQQVLVKPDGFFRIHEKEADGGLSEQAFFLEVDRSSETLETLVARAGCYVDYYKSGGFAMRNGAPRSAYKEYPFRVLMIFKNAERRNNIAERLLENIPPVIGRVCLSTMEELKRNPFGPIWISPLEYRQATSGTVFSPEGKPKAWGYKRQTEREIHVEKNIQKFSLFDT